jgi:hypothetical protein
MGDRWEPRGLRSLYAMEYFPRIEIGFNSPVRTKITHSIKKVPGANINTLKMIYNAFNATRLIYFTRKGICIHHEFLP